MDSDVNMMISVFAQTSLTDDVSAAISTFRMGKGQLGGLESEIHIPVSVRMNEIVRRLHAERSGTDCREGEEAF